MVTNQENITPKEKKESFLTILRDILTILLVVILIRFFIVMPFKIDGDSMMSNFYNEEYILVNRLFHLDIPLLGKIKEYKRGDVVVFKPNLNKNEGKDKKKILWEKNTYFVKRIIGLPGETIRIEGGNVFIKTKNNNDFVKIDEYYLDSDTKYLNYVNAGQTKVGTSFEKFEYEIPEGNYFVMGDNRNGSTDSRSCFKGYCDDGDSPFVSEKSISGTVFFDFGYFHFEGIKPVFTAQMRYSDKFVPSFPRFFSFPKDATYDNLK